MDKQPNVIMLLLTAIGALTTGIVWLAIYIRKLHNKSMDQSNKFTETAAGLKASIDSSVKSTDKVVDVVEDLHKYILSNTHK